MSTEPLDLVDLLFDLQTLEIVKFRLVALKLGVEPKFRATLHKERTNKHKTCTCKSMDVRVCIMLE